MSRMFGTAPFSRVGELQLDTAPDGGFREYHHQLPETAMANRHAAGPFCRFTLPNAPSTAGVYVITTEDVPRYVGECLNLTERFGSRGYGEIFARNCHHDGQSTNCKINAKVLAAAKRGVPCIVWFHATTNRKQLEAQLIDVLRPEWNGRRAAEGSQVNTHGAGSSAPDSSQKSAFRSAIKRLLRAARREGKSLLRIRAGDLHALVGGYPGTAHRMPVCCATMRSEMRAGDQIVAAPPKGNGANVVIEYNLAGREDLDDDLVGDSGLTETSEADAITNRSALVPPPMELASHALPAGARVIVYDYVLMGEVTGEVVEYRRGASPMWRISVESDGGAKSTFFVDARGASHLGRWHVVRVADHPVDRFFSLASHVGPYPFGTQAVPARIVGTAFFPGGSGLWRQAVENRLPALPIGGIMVIGQDFHSRSKYLESARRGYENLADPTWRELRQLMQAASIAENECYFTNAYVGLRTDGSVTGEYPGAKDEEFVSQCRSILAEQITAQRPRLILTLGLPAARMLASLAPNALAGWLDAQSFAEVDAMGGAVLSVRFQDIPDVVSNVVALVHPSMRNSNVDRRSYRDASGQLHEKVNAERAMLADALRGATAV